MEWSCLTFIHPSIHPSVTPLRSSDLPALIAVAPHLPPPRTPSYFHPTRSETFKFKVNMYKLNEEREIKAKTFAHMVSSTLYEKR